MPGIKISVCLLIGSGLELKLIRRNQQCNVLETLAPVDIDLQYDFNYQHFTFLPNEVTVLPVSSLNLSQLTSSNNQTETVQDFNFSLLVSFTPIEKCAISLKVHQYNSFWLDKVLKLADWSVH